MRVNVYPADRFGCGMFRLAWPAEALQAAGVPDIKVRFPDQRWDIGAKTKGREVVGATRPEADVIVLQRPTHRLLVDCIPFWQDQGLRVVIDVDDDLTCIHPSNPAFKQFQPRPGNEHSWQNLQRACQLADVVTVTTPALRSALRKNARILPNYLPDHYYGLEREDTPDVMWPASLGSHPNDAEPLGTALERVVRETGVKVRMLGSEASHFKRAFSLRENPMMTPFVSIEDWPKLLASIGVAVVPLADTKFNAAKSWLKVLELSAVGVPWVASPRADYQRFNSITGVGFLAERPNEWRRHIKSLVTSKDLRLEESENVRKAAERFRLRDHAHLWAEAWLGGTSSPRS